MQSPDLRLDRWLSRIESFSPTEINLGLERIHAVLARLDLRLPPTIFIVGGTNGKGSTVIMLEALLSEAGMRVGSYLSPHIRCYNERIRIGGREARDDEIVTSFEHVEAQRNGEPLTYFEYGTLAALDIFAAVGLDAAVLEIGMGGRLDAVNAIEPTASLITNIALDHCAWLGPDVETIGAEKAGIMRAGKPTVYAQSAPPDSITAHAESIGAQLIIAGQDYQWTDRGDRWDFCGARLALAGLRKPSLDGAIQLQNAAGALALLEASGCDAALEPDMIDRALSRLRLSGRLQSISAASQWLIDVAHNPAAADALAQTVKDRPVGGPRVAIIGMLDDKDVEGVVAVLDPVVDRWVAVRADSPRALPAPELARRAANATGHACLTATSIGEAIDYAESVAGDSGLVVATGSFYLVGPVLEALELRDN